MTSRDEIAARLAALKDGKPIGLVWPLGGSAERDLEWLLAHADALAATLQRIREGPCTEAVYGLIDEALAAYRGEQHAG